MTVGWTIKKNSKAFAEKLGTEAQRKWDLFQNAIFHQNLHPKEAAKVIGGADYKCLNTKCQQYQIRLSYSDRATFTLDEKASLVTVVQVGGHT